MKRLTAMIMLVCGLSFLVSSCGNDPYTKFNQAKEKYDRLQNEIDKNNSEIARLKSLQDDNE